MRKLIFKKQTGPKTLKRKPTKNHFMAASISWAKDKEQRIYTLFHHFYNYDYISRLLYSFTSSFSKKYKL